MRALIQRVTRASVTVDGRTVGAIGPGLVVLVGVRRGDTAEDTEWIAGKLAGLRVFRDEAGKMNRSVVDESAGVLLVSQFTLYGDVRGGRRPSFEKAARPEEAVPLLEDLRRQIEAAGVAVETGEFGAMMMVDLVNDGPVTLMLDSEARKIGRRDRSRAADEVPAEEAAADASAAGAADRMALIAAGSPLREAPLVLASGSPRRRDLLGEIGLRFDVLPPDVDETNDLPEDPSAHARAVAERKARAVAERRPDALILAADTIVVLDGRVFGKPADEADAVRMLTELAGRTHVVHTAVCVLDPVTARIETEIVTTRVTFRAASGGEIRRYVETGEPMDRAGSYAIQGVGGLLVAGIQGDYTNVVGLPVGVTLDLLESALTARAGTAREELR